MQLHGKNDAKLARVICNLWTSFVVKGHGHEAT